MNDIIVSSAYNEQLSSSYYMSIQLRLDGLSFCVIDPVLNTFVAFGNFDFPEIDIHYAKQEELILKQPIFKDQYKKVIVAIENSTFTLIPQVLYSQNEEKSILKFIGASDLEEQKILSDNIEIAGATTLYPIPPFLYYFLQSQFSNIKILHHTTPIVESMLIKRDSDKKRSIVNIVLSNNKITIIAIDNYKLNLCNEFKYNDVNDMIYIVTFTLEQLGMNTQETKIVISGNFAKNDERIVLLQRFTRNINFATIPTYFNYDFVLPEPQHKYSNLFMMSLCV